MFNWSIYCTAIWIDQVLNFILNLIIGGTSAEFSGTCNSLNALQSAAFNWFYPTWKFNNNNDILSVSF